MRTSRAKTLFLGAVFLSVACDPNAPSASQETREQNNARLIKECRDQGGQVVMESGFRGWYVKWCVPPNFNAQTLEALEK